MQTPIEKNIYPTASTQTFDISGYFYESPSKYYLTPSFAPSSVEFPIIIAMIKAIGRGTVSQTM